MWYGIVDGKVCFETKTKSQKAVNLRRDPKLSISVEPGNSYDQLRGDAIDGTARIIDDSTDPLYWPGRATRRFARSWPAAKRSHPHQPTSSPR